MDNIKITNGETMRFGKDNDRINILRGIAESCRDDACFDCPACYPDERNYPYCSLQVGDFLQKPVHRDFIGRGDKK